MNKNVFEGKWKQVSGRAKEWWGKLTHDNRKRAGGKATQFIGLLQQKYGSGRGRARENSTGGRRSKGR